MQEHFENPQKIQGKLLASYPQHEKKDIFLTSAHTCFILEEKGLSIHWRVMVTSCRKRRLI